MEKALLLISLFFWLIACNNTDNRNANTDDIPDSLINEIEEEVVHIKPVEGRVLKINKFDSLALIALYKSTNGENWKNGHL